MRVQRLTSIAAIIGLGIGPNAAAEPWHVGVTSICTGALLFEGRHSIGTAEGAAAVARDIRASTLRRLARIEALPQRPERPLLASRWLATEQRLSVVYANSYVDIWRAIAHANTPVERARLPRRLGVLLHRPDALGARARVQAAALHVPDCTGGNGTAAGGFTP